MAGDWVVWTKGLSRKREVIAIANATGRTRREVAAALMEFWEWADGETADGSLVGVCVRNLSACVADTDESFWRAVVAVGWVVEVSNGLVLPHFTRWMGQSAKRRLTDSERKRISRNGLQDVLRDVPPECGHGDAEPVRKMSAPDADKNGTREEKSKESKKKTPLPPIPESLDTPEFREAWDRWQAYRRENRKTLTPSTVVAQFRTLAKMGPARAIAAIDHTIFKGWDGLVEPRPERGGAPADTFGDFMKGFQGHDSGY